MLRFCLVALALTACTDTASSPVVEQVAGAIRNGTRDSQITPLSSGQILALGWLHDAGRPGRNFCTGTLIAPRYVVTAKHCVEGRSGRTIGFGIGLLPSNPDASFTVDAAISHPTRDVALLRLSEDAVARVPELVPVLPNREAPWEGLLGSEVEAGGYGETYDPTREGRYFAVVLLEELTNEFVLVDGRGRQGICFGDSGGPVLAVNPAGEVVILGVESSGDASCVDRDRLTRLDGVVDWLDDNTGPVPPNDLCGELDRFGRCDGGVAEWCENGVVQRMNCEQRSQICDFVSEDVGFACTDAPACGDINSGGVCDGDRVARCRFGRLAFEDCARLGRVCQTDRGGAFCSAALEPDAEVADAEVADAQEVDAEQGDAVMAVDAAQAPDALQDDSGGSEAPRTSDEGCHAGGRGGSGMAGLLLVVGLARRRRVRLEVREVS